MIALQKNIWFLGNQLKEFRLFTKSPAASKHDFQLMYEYWICSFIFLRNHASLAPTDDVNEHPLRRFPSLIGKKILANREKRRRKNKCGEKHQLQHAPNRSNNWLEFADDMWYKLTAALIFLFPAHCVDRKQFIGCGASGFWCGVVHATVHSNEFTTYAHYIKTANNARIDVDRYGDCGFLNYTHPPSNVYASLMYYK